MTELTEAETRAQRRERDAIEAWSDRVVALVLAGVPLPRAWCLANKPAAMSALAASAKRASRRRAARGAR